MAPLRFVNKLSKEEINEILNFAGYELNEFIFNEKGLHVPSYEVLENNILCRCYLSDKKRKKP